MNLRSLLCTVAVVAGLSVAALSHAHAHPQTASPAADAVVAAPAEVGIVFSEMLEPAFSTLVVTDANGTAVTSAKAELDDATHKRLRLIMPRLAPGTYQVKWVAVAVDGHRSSGSYRFTVK